MHIKTMAVKITEKTYPIAVACLTKNFMFIPMKDVLGRYLVINDVRSLDSDTLTKSLQLTNIWLEEDLFRENFEFIDGELKTNFAEVRHL